MLAQSPRLSALVLASTLLLSSCLTEIFTEKSSYKPQREPGQAPEESEGESGYKTVIAGDDRYNVEFTVKGRNDLRDAAIWGLYRCAEIAMQEDAPYLVLMRGRVAGKGYEYVLKGARPYLPEKQPETGVKGGTASFLFKIFKDRASAEAFKNDPSVEHPLVYESKALLQRLASFQKLPDAAPAARDRS